MADADRCPNCGRLWEDCDAYMREEGVAAGQDPRDYCQRGARLRLVPPIQESAE